MCYVLPLQYIIPSSRCNTELNIESRWSVRRSIHRVNWRNFHLKSVISKSYANVSHIMGALVWGLLVIVICPLLQVPVIIYVGRYLEVESDTVTGSDTATGTDATETDATTETDIVTDTAGKEPLYPPALPYWVGSGHHPVQSFDSGSRERSDSTITCPHCGTENDRYYTYCRNCVARLPTVGI